MQNRWKNTYRVKHRKLILALKFFVICYILLFTASYLSSDTSAYFNTQSTVSPNVAAGVWDKGKEEATLLLKNLGNRTSSTCPDMIRVSLKNTGNADMREEGTYKIYYAEKGDPQKGKVVKKAPVRIPFPSETLELNHEATKSGTYIFEVVQPDGEHIWSKPFTLTCDKKADEIAENTTPSTSQSGKNEKQESSDKPSGTKKESNETDQSETDKTDATADKQADDDKNTESDAENDEDKSDSHAEQKPDESLKK